MSTLTTERLILRPLREGDGKMMFRNWVSDERVAEYCRWYAHKDISETQEFLKMCLDEAEKGFEYRWGITLKDSGELIGCIDVVDITENGKAAEVGYVLGYNYWGRGIMTECVKAVIAELFNSGFDKVIAKHAIENPRSGRVMEKCGMKYSNDCEERRKFGSDEMIQCRCYEITK